jgi:hypothetical protein
MIRQNWRKIDGSGRSRVIRAGRVAARPSDFSGRRSVATNPNPEEQGSDRDDNRESEAVHGINLRSKGGYVQASIFESIYSRWPDIQFDSLRQERGSRTGSLQYVGEFSQKTVVSPPVVALRISIALPAGITSLP